MRFLDQAVLFSDNILAIRNDPVNGRIMWTGNRELVWPTKPLNATNAGYAGCESMEVVGHMVQSALYILKNSCLWKRRPQQSDILSVFGANATYLDRAIAYVHAADATYNSYYRRWFFSSTGSMQQPNDPRWNSLGDIPAGTSMPWNRRAMMTNAMLKLAAAHAVPKTAVTNLTFTRELERLVSVQVHDLARAMKPAVSPNDGSPILSWSYSSSFAGVQQGGVEQTGLHGAYDLWGLFEAWRYGIAPDVLNKTLMPKLANTLYHAVYKPQWQGGYLAFAGQINGFSDRCSSEAGPRSWIYGHYAFYSRWVSQLYSAIATPDLKNQPQRLEVVAPLLLAKAAQATPSWFIGSYVWGNSSLPKGA